jgi:hypothetical protein
VIEASLWMRRVLIGFVQASPHLSRAQVHLKGSVPNRDSAKCSSSLAK